VKILVVPPNDLLRHPIPNRMYHVVKRFENKHEIFLLTYTNHPLATRSVKRNLKAVEVPIPRAVYLKNLGLYYLINTPQIYATLNRILQQEDIDAVLHANILPSIIAAKLAKRYKKTAIYDYLDHFPESASAYYATGKQLVETGVRILTTQAIRYSDAIITPSYGLKKLVEATASHIPVYVIPNGVDPQLFQPQDKAVARRTLGLDETPYVILLHGSLDTWIDITAILGILKKLRLHLIDARLLIVGFSHGGTYYKQLLNMAKRHNLEKHLYLYPPQPYEKMPLFINSSDIVFAPYVKSLKNFATPLKVAEALACGVPVVTTDIPEFKLWYQHGLYIYKDYTELQHIVTRVLQHIEEIKDTLRRYSQAFRQRFSWDRIAEEYETIIEITAKR